MVKDWCSIFYLDKSSPSGLRWKIDRWAFKHQQHRVVAKDSVAGIQHYRGKGKVKPKAWQVCYEKRHYNVHRIIWEILYGPIPSGMVIDHLDRNPFNNDISNLELKTPTKNNRNVSKNPRNTSGETGVVKTSYKTKEGVCIIYRAFWHEDGKQKSKSFNATHLGETKAFQFAVEFRLAKIRELNTKGYQYESGHGT